MRKGGRVCGGGFVGGRRWSGSTQQNSVVLACSRLGEPRRGEPGAKTPIERQEAEMDADMARGSSADEPTQTLGTVLRQRRQAGDEPCSTKKLG